MSRLFISNSPNISTLEGTVAEVQFPPCTKAGVLHILKAKCRLAKWPCYLTPNVNNPHVARIACHDFRYSVGSKDEKKEIKERKRNA